MAFVTIRIKNTEGFSRTELTRDRMVVGRSSAADLPVKNNTLSREHCAFVREADRWFVEDLGSQNGTWVNKTRVFGRAPLAERDIVKAGQSRLTFHTGALPAAGAHESDDEVDDGDEPAALELSLAADDPTKGDGATDAVKRPRNENEPAEAMACTACGSWFSTAHRLAGDHMPCPRCGHTNTVA